MCAQITSKCPSGDLTGPIACHVTVVRHPRFRPHSQILWKDVDLQHHGKQTVEELNYIMESRPEKGLYIFMHNQAPQRLQVQAVPVHHDILWKQALEADPALQIIWHNIDCE